MRRALSGGQGDAQIAKQSAFMRKERKSNFVGFADSEYLFGVILVCMLCILPIISVNENNQ